MKTHLVSVLALAVVGVAGAAFVLLGSGGTSPTSPFDDTSATRSDEVQQLPGVAVGSDAPGEHQAASRSAVPTGTSLAPGAWLALTGRVVDVAGGPIAEAQVVLRARRDFQMDGGNADFRRIANGADFREMIAMRNVGQPVRTTTDGRFAIRAGVFDHTAFELLVHHDEFAPALVRRSWVRTDGELPLGEVVLSSGGVIDGYVVDSNDAPIAGALVAYSAPRGRGPGGQDRGGRPDSGAFEGLVRPAVTDAAGAFRLEHVPPGRSSLRAEAARHVPATLANLDVEDGQALRGVTLRLEPGGEAAGIVVDPNGHAIADAEIELSRSRANDESEDAGGPRRRGFGPREVLVRTRSEDDGTFRLSGVPTSGGRLSITHPRYLDGEIDPVSPNDRTPLEIRLDPRLELHGVVVDERTNQTIERFGITARRIDERGFGGGRRGRGDAGPFRGESPADDQGRNRGRPVEPAPAADPERAARAAERESRAADADARRRQREEYLVARLGSSGRPAGSTPAPEPHASGRFTITDLEPGDWILDVAAPGWAATAIGPVRLERGQTIGELAIRLPRAAHVEGVVLDRATGEPIANAVVELSLPPLPGPRRDPAGEGGRRGFGGGFGFGGPDPWAVDSATTDASGRFVLRAQRDGRYVLTARAPDHHEFVDENVVLNAAAGAVVRELALAGGARVRGAVLGLAPDERASLVFRLADGPRQTVAVDPATGTYEILGLAAGGYFVEVERRDANDDRRRRMATAVARSAAADPDLYVAEGADLRYDVDANRNDLGALRGRIRINGAVPSGFEVALRQQGAATEPRGGRGRFGGFLRSDVAENGEFEVGSVPPGAYDLEVRRAGGGRGRGQGGGTTIHREPVTIAAGHVTERAVDLLTGRLQLSLRTADGQPLSRARITVVRELEASGLEPSAWGELPSFRRVDAGDGVTTIDDLPLGAWHVVVSSTGFADAAARVVVQGPTDAPTELRLRPAPEPGK